MDFVSVFKSTNLCFGNYAFRDFLPQMCTKMHEHVCKDVCGNVHRSAVCNSKGLETT